MSEALVFRHLPFEGLDGFAPVLDEAGFTQTVVDMPVDDLNTVDPLAADLLVILGGPIGVHDAADYPFLDQEKRLLRARLDADLPTLGICLGAQLIAEALGADVSKLEGGQELGWVPLELTDTGMNSPMRHLAGAGIRVFQWHGDTFAIPEGATRLAGSARCTNQAFNWGRATLAVQCHPEVTARGLETWYVSNAGSLGGNNPSAGDMRRNATRFAPGMQSAARRFLLEWLEATIVR